MQATRYLVNATILLLVSATVTANEDLIVEELNLRQKELNRIVDVARNDIARNRKVPNVNAYKIRGDNRREALVTFEPWSIDENSFEAIEVICQKRNRTWRCEEPNSSKYYYEHTLSNSIALGEGVSVSVARELLTAARGSSGTVGRIIGGRYLQLGGDSHIVRNSKSEYTIYGWCDCLLERTTEGFTVARYLDVI